MLPGQLISRLGDETLGLSVYGSPLTIGVGYAVGTPERTAIIDAYRHTQRLLCITGISFVLFTTA